MNQPPLRIVTAGMLVAALATACLAAGAASLGDREFVSLNVTDGGAPRPLVPGTTIRLRFSGRDLGASAGCNSIGGTYRIDNGRLVFEGGAMTEMGCDADRHAQDDWLVGLLASNPAVRLVGNDLTLEVGSVVVSLKDRSVVEPDANIVGPTWTLVSVIRGDSVSSVPDAASATLEFGAGGALEVFTGCNRGSGTWSATAGGIDVSEITLTRMACDAPAGSIEAAVLTVLESDSIRATIRSDILTLQAGPNGLQLQAR